MLEAEQVAVGFGDDEDDVEAEGHLEEVVVQRVGREASDDATELRAMDSLLGRFEVRDDRAS